MSAAPINPEIEVMLRAVDNLSAVITTQTAALNGFTEAITATNAKLTETRAQTKQTSMSMRRMALDLRMISIGTALLRREIGDTNPIIDMFSKGLLIVSSAATATIAAVDLFQRSNIAATLSTFTLAKAVDALNLAFMKLMMHPVILAIALIAAAIFAITVAFSPAAQAAASFKEEVNSLTDAVEDAKVNIDSLRYAMEGLGIEQQKLRIQELEITAAIEKRGFATKQEEALLRNIAIAQSNLNLQTERGRLSQQELNYEMHAYQMRLDDIERATKDLPAFGFAPGFRPNVPNRSGNPDLDNAFGQQGAAPTFTAFRTTSINLPQMMMGGTDNGKPIFTRSSDEPSPDTSSFQRPGMMSADIVGRNNSRPISVTISLAGATISNEFDLHAALINSASDAAMEVRRQL